MRQEKSQPLVQTLYEWLMLNRQKVPEGSATAKAIDYTLRRWKALTRFLEDGQLPVDNNWIENQIRPIAIGRNNWLFAGSLRAGQRAAAVMSLIQLRIPLMADTDSTFIADSIPYDGGHPAQVS
jgi:hypothetical protein